LRVCVVAEYYPRRRDPVLGVWAHRQALAAREAGAEVRVLALERPIPPAATVRSALRGRPRRLAAAVAGAMAQPRRDVLDGLEVEYVRFLSPPRQRTYAHWDRWARRPLTRALERMQRSAPIDVLHAHYALPAGAAARPFAAWHGIPLVVSVHGGDVLGPLLAGAEARARVGEVLRQSAAVLCNSSATRERVATLAGSGERMRVVHLGASAPRRRPEPRSDPTVATLGHVVGRKRHADVLHALALLSDRVPALHWLVIGDGPESNSLERLARELGVSDRVTWAGRLEPERALEELASCHVMAMPSVDEAFGVAYVEALACGVPAIGCRGEGGPEEIAALGEGMLLIPAGNVAALAEAIAEVVADPARRRELSEGARRTAAEHFSWEACGHATVSAYEDALRER
jgi:teichuronic acid biosynthesis glycosyltransferase TuaC